MKNFSTGNIRWHFIVLLRVSWTEVLTLYILDTGISVQAEDEDFGEAEGEGEGDDDLPIEPSKEQLISPDEKKETEKVKTPKKKKKKKK